MNARAGIVLLREELSSHAVGHVTRLPRWAMPEDAEGYWHIPRAAELQYADMGRVQFWCGQSRHMPLSRFTNKTPSDMRCGTCEGRAKGYERSDGAIFRPRDRWMLPRYCPAFGGKEGRCWLCGARRSFSRDYGGYSERRHLRGKGLEAYTPCPRHGWRDMSARDGRLRCHVFAGGHVTRDGYCDYSTPVAPHAQDGQP